MTDPTATANPYARDVLFSRMLGIIDETELKTLATKTIAVPGCGGVGYTHAETLVRMGVGGVHIADFDTFGPENFSRQFGATVHTVGARKADVLEERLLSINPELRIRKIEGISKKTVDEFLDGVDVVCDALDYFVIEPRIMVYGGARERSIPVVMSGPVGYGATHHYFDPEGMGFADFFDLTPDLSEQEKITNFGLGIAPLALQDSYLKNSVIDFEAQTGAAVSSACLLATTLSTTSAFALLLGKEMFVKPVPYIYHIDYLVGRFVEHHLMGGVRKLKERMAAGDTPV
ncbi:ThiF family adenylyltransferase [Frankia sp. CiP3]|uniref:ThiF family adenylyltransferase n=1 Tax=Frankia sp. CiP3 TaxID=2880971 RepID=UPI001EF467E2|nr:ThiF family adenylyltransferase [Frankia sp. CiP3]